MTTEQDYTLLTCPLPGCTTDLHLMYTTDRALYVSDLDDMPGPDDHHTLRWEVTCEEGHTVLVPDGADDVLEFGPEDVERLRALTAGGGMVQRIHDKVRQQMAHSSQAERDANDEGRDGDAATNAAQADAFDWVLQCPDEEIERVAGGAVGAEYVASLRAYADGLEAVGCTGLSAQWCPNHGTCACPDREEAMNDPNCPLHSRTSSHAETDQ